MEESQRFPIVLRGYARDEVDAAIAGLEARIAEAEAELASARTMLEDAGLGGARDVASELDAVAEDVGRILHEARAAAEQMRSRAAADAAQWRADADTETRRLRVAAAEAARQARSDAWQEGTALLDSAVAESEQMLQSASDDALYLRAEAEREALRLTSDARRERDEAMRRVKEEGEQILAVARKDAETILSSARHQAEAAQERARALEARRAELLAELEAARSSIGLIEAEAVPESTEESGEEPTHWPEDEGSVRIVAGSRVVRSIPVDALELAAEVEALQRTPVMPVEPEPVAAAPEPSPVAQEPAEPEEPAEPAAEEPEVAEPAAEELAEPEAAAAPVPQPPPEETTAELPVVPPAPEAEPEIEEQPSSVPAEGEDHISDLFASLRSVPEPPKPEAELEPVAAEQPPAEEAPADTVEPSRAEPTRPPGARPDPEVRDRLLLPVQNRALRDIKRTIVELQNRVLEELRVEPGWTPDEAMFSAFDDELAQVQRESVMAGFTAARELTGADETPRPEGVRPESIADRFSGDLRSTVVQSLEHSRSTGAGARETAAAVSRVFRAWRTDEAEKRVRTAAQGAYDEALAAGLAELGADDPSGLSPVAS